LASIHPTSEHTHHNPHETIRMTRRSVVLAAVAALAVTAPAAGASAPAAAPKPIASYCSPSGDLCYGIRNRSGAVHLELTTFARYFTRYRLCVKPAGAAERCRAFAIRRQGRFFGSIVRWYGNYPSAGPGSYRVTWRLGTERLGPSLTFRLPLR
jgi:hypothetical protein